MPLSTISRTRASSCARIPSAFQLSARQAPERVEIFRARPLDHVLGQAGYGRLLVPLDRLEIVAHELLVEARLRAAGRVAVRRPEARRIGRHHLVDQDDLEA